MWMAVRQGRALRLPRQADTPRGCSPIQTIVWADPLLGEPAADFGEELSSRAGRRRPLLVEIPAIVALLADAAAVAPQPLDEQDRTLLVRCADPHRTSV
jgi:hypothetical protein